MADDMKSAAAAPDAPAPGSTMTVHTGTPPMVPEQPAPSALPAIVRRNVAVLRPIADALILVQVQTESRDLIAKLLKDGKDYGTVPGVKKPTLFKPGAEKFNNAYGLRAHFIVVEKEVDHYRQIDWTKSKDEWSGPKGSRRKETKTVGGTSLGLYRYVIECQLIDRASGEVVGSSLGSCSTLESKYIDRPRDLENTIIKMAEKRALIGSTLLVHGLSEQFTQDVEDTGLASDDSQAIAVQPVDDLQNLPEVGSGEWAITFPIPTGIHTGMKLPEEVKTFGQLTWKQLESIIAGMERITKTAPDKKDACAIVIRGAKRMQEELEERAAMADDGDTTAAKAAERPAPAPMPAAAAVDPVTADSQAAANEDDDLPF